MKILTADRDYLFDSTVYIDYFRRRPVALALFQQAREDYINVAFSVVTLTELWSGINRYWNEERTQALLILQQPITIDAATAKQAGTFRRMIRSQLSGRGGLPSVPDSLIAATAYDRDHYVLTRNQRHFQHFQQFGVNLQFYEIP